MLEYIDSSLSDLGWKSNVNLDLWRCLVRLNKFSNSSDFGFNIYKKNVFRIFPRVKFDLAVS